MHHPWSVTVAGGRSRANNINCHLPCGLEMGELWFSLKKPQSSVQGEGACPIPGEASYSLFLQIVHHVTADEQLPIGFGGGNAVPLPGGRGP